MILIGIGSMQMLGGKAAEVKFEKGNSVLGSQGVPLKIKVDVEGQVLNPGVYSLNADSRVQDALIAAGGLTSDANRNAINLAAKLIDGQKIYVPAVGESVSSYGNNPNQGSTLNSGDISGLISINSATEAQLDSLPSIGPVTAQKIINGRPYSSIEEILSKKAVGKATFGKIKDLISL